MRKGLNRQPVVRYDILLHAYSFITSVSVRRFGELRWEATWEVAEITISSSTTHEAKRAYLIVADFQQLFQLGRPRNRRDRSQET